MDWEKYNRQLLEEENSMAYDPDDRYYETRLDEANELINEAVRSASRLGQSIDYQGTWFTLKVNVIDRHEALRHLENGTWDQLNREQKNQALEALKTSISLADEFWDSSSAHC